MKRVAIVLSVAGLVLSLTGCSSQPPECESYDETEALWLSWIQGWQFKDEQMTGEFFAGQSTLTLEEYMAKHDDLVRSIEQTRESLRERADLCGRAVGY
jgi:hypothetical protein